MSFCRGRRGARTAVDVAGRSAQSPLVVGAVICLRAPSPCPVAPLRLRPEKHEASIPQRGYYPRFLSSHCCPSPRRSGAVPVADGHADSWPSAVVGRRGRKGDGQLPLGERCSHGLPKKLKKAHMQERRRPAEQPGARQSNQRWKQEKAWGTQRGSAQGWARRTWWPGGSPSTSGALLFFKSPGGKSTVDTSWFCWL